MIRYSTIPSVRRRQHAIEREVLAHMKRRANGEWSETTPKTRRIVDMFLLSRPWRNALERLRAKKLVKPGKHYGYVITPAGWRSR